MVTKIIKVYEEGCSVCETMSRFDRSVLDGYPSSDLVEIPFEDVQDYLGNPFRQLVYRLLEKYAVSSTYEIEFPTYLFLGEGEKYLGHLQGALELRDFREGVKTLLGQPSE